jgi:hypothetical protein
MMGRMFLSFGRRHRQPSLVRRAQFRVVAVDVISRMMDDASVADHGVNLGSGTARH